MDLPQSVEEGKPCSILGRLDASVLCCNSQLQGPDQHLSHCRCMLWTCHRAWRQASREALRCPLQIPQWHTTPPTQSLMGQMCKRAEACRKSASQSEEHSLAALCFRTQALNCYFASRELRPAERWPKPLQECWRQLKTARIILQQERATQCRT